MSDDLKKPSNDEQNSSLPSAEQPLLGPVSGDQTASEQPPSGQSANDQGAPTPPPEEAAPKPPPPGLWSGNDPVGSITSPSETGRYRMVLRDYAAMVQIEGSLVTLDYSELDSEAKEQQKTILCQVSRTRLQNIHHENRLLGALLREKGRIPGLSAIADHKEVDLLPMDTILVGTTIHQLPRNVPPTGTDVRFASVEDVHHFSGVHPALFNIGYLYETAVPVGLMLKHFGRGDDGWGDAHMLGVFGVSGSGKTVMAASIVSGFAARREMGMLIVDPQGQFSASELGNDPKKWSWQLNEAFRLVGRGPDVFTVSMDDIALESPALFVQLLDRFDFFDALSIVGHEKKEQLGTDLLTFLSEWLRENESGALGDLRCTDELLGIICTMGAATYADPEKKTEQMKKAFFAAPFKVKKAQMVWERVREMFARPLKIGDLLDQVLIGRKIVILNVDAAEGIKDLYCAEILTDIEKKAEAIYRVQQGKPWRGDPVGKYKKVETNALIVIDEAHRFAPQSAGSNKDQEKMLHTLVDAIRTTRKLGVGWCYVTQSIASFNKDIFRQIQTKILGVGIGTGADNEHLESAFNNDKDLIERYRTLPRPITTGVFPFAIIGELVALGNGSRALFISATKTQQELFALNPNHFKYPNGAPVSGTKPRPSDGRKPLPAAQQLLLPPVEDNIPF
ncbi:MAG TPA: DUF87 domain-containing protein [Ktedonobacteraceae bacterium]|nr:DUF87 domain-containing protein [Ktedonobacteraceae bacterium]